MKENIAHNVVLGILIFLVFSPKFIEAQVNKSDSLKNNNKKLSAKLDSVKKKSPTGAMIRSLIFPGLGQWYNNKKIKAFLVFCAQSGLLANSIYLNQKYVTSSTEFERNFYINNRNLSVWWLVGTTLFSMADAFVDAHLADFDESPDLSNLIIHPTIMTGDPGIQVSFCFRF